MSEKIILGIAGLGTLAQRTAQVENLRVDVEAVDGVYTKRKDILCILLDTACRCCQNSNIHIAQLADILYNGVTLKLCGKVFSARTANDTRNLKIGRCIERLQCIFANVAIANYGCSNFSHK